MKRFLLAAAAGLLAASTADAEYVIIRVKLNNGTMPDTVSAGYIGGPSNPGPGGGFIGQPAPIAPGGPPAPGGPGPGGGNRGTGGGGTGGPPGVPPAPSPGGSTGFVGGQPGGQLGLGGGVAQPNHYKLGPDDYVTVAVPIKNMALLKNGFTFGKDANGQPENIGVAGHFNIQTKHGYTYINANQDEIILDYKGKPKRDAGFDPFPEPLKQLELIKKDDKRYGTPDGQLQVAEWCLTVGLPDESMKILDYLTTHPKKEEFSPRTANVLAQYAKVKDLLNANVDKTDRANAWKERLNYPLLTVSKHYAIVHEDVAGSQASAERRLEALEMNFKTVYLWFAFRGKALPAPTEKLPAVIVGDAAEFRRYRDNFEASNLASDGFHARRENLAVFSARRLDKASVNFESKTKEIYRHVKSADDYFQVKLPNAKENANAHTNFRDYARASTLALVDRALREEGEIASATHEGTKQLFAETGLLPRNVLAPEWVRFGIAALFEMPKGPFPGGAGQLKVALYPGGGGPHWAYMRYFEEMREAKRITNNMAPQLFIETILDEPFRTARKAEALERSMSTKGQPEGDSKATTSEQLYAQARTLSWSIVYFLAKEKYPEFEKFLTELSALPRDAELDAEAVMNCFGKAFGVSFSGLAGDQADIQKISGLGMLWMQFMASQQSPSKSLKIDAVVGAPEGMLPGGPGGPAGPSIGPGIGPGIPGPGGPGGPGGPRPPGGGPGGPRGPGM